MRRRLAGPLVAVALVASGCAGDEPEAAAPSEAPPSGPAPAVSTEESYRILRDWTVRHNKAVASGVPAQWRDLATGGLEQPLIRRVWTYGKLPPSTRVALRNPAMYVPRLAGHPKWFAAAAVDDVDGPGRQVLVVFQQAKPNDRWRAAHWLVFRGRPPALNFDREGYAVPTADRSLAAGHSAFLTTGDASRFRPDGFTRRARRPAPPRGWSMNSRYAPTRHPVFALRTGDGGSLVWYSVEQRTTYRRAPRGRPATLPPDLRGALAQAKRLKAATVETTWIWLAIGYAPPRGPAHVIGESLHLTDVRAR
ncbi:hypothetical protein [Thermomonospora umbrina]|uniref:DUF8094 domain-containing protein n=1 Tax=Thermomonospora umbrina TaxID=111806 RepID=A0A3D9SZS0_9ACTN|nr:hypothetical protein [Thermomonospora umbrina]REE98495.1 hypothetical protein DFJ69_3984 [Thermomonospora umbrina]